MKVSYDDETQSQLENMFVSRDDIRAPRFESLEELKVNISSNADLRKRRDYHIDIEGDSLVLLNFTEMAYKVPPNTTLIRVYGPVGVDNTTYDGGLCYAAVEPRPAWWSNDSFPLAAGYKLTNSTNRTMFLLPVDPAVESMVKIGALGWDASCRISGISSYPFHL